MKQMITAIPWLYFEGAQKENRRYSYEGHLLAKHLEGAIELARKNPKRNGGMGRFVQKVKEHFYLHEFEPGIMYRGIQPNNRGIHSNQDGSHSDNQDYIVGLAWKIPVVTNSLGPHYLRWYFHLLSENDVSIANNIFLAGTPLKGIHIMRNLY